MKKNIVLIIVFTFLFSPVFCQKNDIDSLKSSTNAPVKLPMITLFNAIGTAYHTNSSGASYSTRGSYQKWFILNNDTNNKYLLGSKCENLEEYLCKDPEASKLFIKYKRKVKRGYTLMLVSPLILSSIGFIKNDVLTLIPLGAGLTSFVTGVVLLSNAQKKLYKSIMTYNKNTGHAEVFYTGGYTRDGNRTGKHGIIPLEVKVRPIPAPSSLEIK